LCSIEVPAEHRHVLDIDTQNLLCACTACSLLFERDAAALGHLRLIPRLRQHLDIEVAPQDVGIPVGLVFFVRQLDETVVAFYPSPIGVTKWEVDPERWAQVTAACPATETMRPSVEALLVNTAHGADEHWLVGIDECYRLAALLRRQWRGLSGGNAVWQGISEFFDELRGTAARRCS
jgi:hypothetical protein